jgi:major vault protein
MTTPTRTKESPMEERRPRERELVLSPNEYAYILDTTKGHINCYVGPNKTSLAQTDELVVFDERTKRFERVHEMQRAILVFATAPTNWYLVVKNPAKSGQRPLTGVSATAPELAIGTKVVVPGPASFALWPGQMARVIEGHALRSNQYLVVRIYDAERAKGARPALFMEESTPLVVGEQRIIRGSQAAFFIPPDGVEVVADSEERMVRDAVTLQRLEYCILVSEDGRKTFVRGEAVVFPEPTQRFVEREGRRAFQAIELSDVTGIHIKVISPYTDVDDDGAPRQHREGEELFLTGKNKVYFPRAEHAIIKIDEHEMHHAVAIPRGEGRYVLDRETGEVRLKSGPLMFLPDPRREVIVRRVLSDRECRRMYPGNETALAFNKSLRAKGSVEVPRPIAQVAAVKEPLLLNEPGEFRRAPFKAPRTITLDTRSEGVVSVDVWSGYAVQIVDRAGGRRVVRGPKTVLLGYDETLDALTLSTGTPKRSEMTMETAYLQLAGNKVSDLIEVTTSDLVRASLQLKYRVNFEGDDPARWFAVENYVQLLVDHASSIVMAAARRFTIHELRRDVTAVVRDALLGEKPAEGDRKGLAFHENAMRVYDVEVLSLSVQDPEVEGVLRTAERRAIALAVDISERETRLVRETRRLELDRMLSIASTTSRLESLSLDAQVQEREHLLETDTRARMRQILEADRARELRDAELTGEIRRLKLEADLEAHDAQVRRKREMQVVDLERLAAEVDGAVRQASAFSPQLVAVLQRLGDEHFVASMSENFSELAAVEGRGVLETARKFLDFIPSSMVPQLRAPTVEPRKDGES